MNTINQVRQHIEQLPAGKPFSALALRSYSTSDNARQILSRLVKTGELQRVSRGLFVKPFKTLTASNLPSVVEMVASLAAITGETIAVHGAEAALQLQLSTQMPMRPIFYTSGNTRTLKLAGRTVELIHANPKTFRLAGTFAGLAITALNYTGKENVTLQTLQKLHQFIGEEKFVELQQALQYMPAWMADLFYRYQQTDLAPILRTPC